MSANRSSIDVAQIDTPPISAPMVGLSGATEKRSYGDVDPVVGQFDDRRGART